VNLKALVDPDIDSGVPGGTALLEFAAAVIGPDRSRLDAARAALAAELGPAAVTGASAVAGNFSKNDRIADATGIPADPPALKATKQLRAELGLNDFKSAINSLRHFPDS
jgi:hypothetical protein